MCKFVSFLLLINVVAAKAQNFNLGNFVVVKIGSGITGSLSSAAAAPVVLEEYKQDGTPVRSIALPTTLPPSGLNKRLTCNGASTSEGSLNISTDGQFLTLCGYDADVATQGGTALGGVGSSSGIDNTSPNKVNRVVGIVDFSGNINTSTALNDAFDKTNIRSAITDNGNNIWMCGSLYNTPSTLPSAGIRYTMNGYTTSTKISNNNFDNEKVIGISDGQLYATSGLASTKSIYTIGNGLPSMPLQNTMPLLGIPNGSIASPSAFVFFDVDPSVPGPDLLYVCDDANASIQGVNKYSFDGTTWTNRGRLMDDCTGITGYINCNNQTVLFITSTNNANNKIYKFIDQSSYNATITSDGLALSGTGVAIILVNGAGSNKVFRGIQMAPGIGLTLTGTSTIPAGNYNKITIKNGANVTLAGNIAIADKLVVETGAMLDCGGSIISSVSNTAGYFELQSGATLKIGSTNGIAATTLSGNIQTCSRRFNSGGFYEYNGTAMQNTGDGLPALITGRLTLNNAANLTLSAPTKVGGLINFTVGVLRTTAFNILTVTSSTQYSKYSSTYSQIAEEASFIDGPVKFESNANTYQFVPIGKGAHFAPMSILPFNNILKTYTAEYFAATPIDNQNIAGGLDHISKLEYWDISCSATTNPDMDAEIGLYWNPKSIVGHAGDDLNALPDLRIAHYVNTGSGLIWQIDAGATASGFNTTGDVNYGKILAKNNTTHFSPFTLASSSYRNLLPVQLANWFASKTNNKVKLQWQTVDEVDMDHFAIERSQDGEHFAAFKDILANNKTGINNYEVIDDNPSSTNFYRLAIIGKNGQKDYSSINKIIFENVGKILLYPNPAKGFVNINLPTSFGVLRLTDPTGKTLQTLHVENNVMRLNVQNLAAGTYYVLFNGVGKTISLKFVLL